MKKIINLHWRAAALKNGFMDAVAYRAEFFIDIIGSALVPASIQLILWYAVFYVGQANSFGGMSFIELINYTIISVLFSQIRGGNQDFELQEMIRTGNLSQHLLKPIGIVEFVYIRGVAPKLVIASVCICIGVVLSIWLPITVPRIFGAMFLALLGNIIHYQVGAILSTFSFLWEEAYSVLMVKNLIVSILSGELLPLNLFPASMSWVWKATPFYLYVFGPTQFALGKWSVAQYLHALGVSVVWIAVLCVGIRISWHLGIRRYQSLGG
ncbi:MAG: ABC-2 family transporter protein [Deltaproteobacteria bacterium]|nr:ABC-2 family transporter protein [Deltaproteobacteria bacterium]